MFSSVRAGRARSARLRSNSWFQDHLKCFAAADESHRLIKFFQGHLCGDESAIDENLRQSGFEHAPHGFPSFKKTPADNSADRQPFENNIVSEVQFHFTIGNAQKDKSATPTEEVEPVRAGAAAARHLECH